MLYVCFLLCKLGTKCLWRAGGGVKYNIMLTTGHGGADCAGIKTLLSGIETSLAALVLGTRAKMVPFLPLYLVFRIQGVSEATGLIWTFSKPQYQGVLGSWWGRGLKGRTHYFEMFPRPRLVVRTYPSLETVPFLSSHQKGSLLSHLLSF